MTSRNYPVVSERPLAPSKQRLLLRSKRDLSELPQQEPGTVLVFEVNGRHEAFPERRHLTGAENVVVEAVSVSVIDVRARQIPVEISIPSSSPADDFLIRVWFGCEVTKPEAVAAAGLTDIRLPLRSHLKGDRKLLRLGTQHNIEEINEVRWLAHNQVQAYCTVDPPELRGVDIALLEVEVLTPDPLRKHSAQVRDVEWDHNLAELKQAFESRDVERLQALISRGPEAITALGIHRREVHTADAVRDAREAEEQRRKHWLEAFRALPPEYLDSLPIDALQLLQNATPELQNTKSGPADAGGQGSRRSADDDKPQILDEDGFR